MILARLRNVYIVNIVNFFIKDGDEVVEVFFVGGIFSCWCLV